MPTRLGCLSLSSEYSCSGHINADMASHACYSYALGDWDSNTGTPHKNIWKIRARIKTPAEISSSGCNNFCLLNKEEVESHLEYCKTVYGIDFDYTVEEKSDHGKKFYLLTVDIDRRKTEQKFVLTWIRHIYEFPYNMFLLDALKLKNEENVFTEEHILNILQVVGTTYELRDEDGHWSSVSDYTRWYRTDQCLCKPYNKLESIETIKENNSHSGYITAAYKRSMPTEEIVHFKDKSSDEVQESMTLEYWQNPDNWEERRMAYLENYKLYQDRR